MTIEISDIKQAYLKWNEKGLERMLLGYEPSQQSALRVIPLLLQVNHRLLPGYNGPNTPSGIYGYQPSKSIITTAKQINNRFVHDQLAPLKNTIIESVFLQRGVVDARLTLWVIHTDNIKPDKITDLNDKVQRIALWLRNRGLVITAHLVTVDKICSRAMKQFNAKTDACDLVLDYFYYESFLLAGKYPVWWLVPPDKETNYAEFVEHIKQARFVNESEYLDLGGIAKVSQRDITSVTLGKVYGVYQQPEIVWLNLLLLYVRQSALPEVDGLAWRLKLVLYEAAAQGKPVDESRVLVALIKDALSRFSEDSHAMPINKLLSQIERTAPVSVRWIFQRLQPQKVEQPLMLRQESLDVVRYLNLFKALIAEIRMVFEKTVSTFDMHINEDKDKTLSATAYQLLNFMTDSDTRVPLYNVQYKPDMVLDRIVIKHEGSKNHQDYWALVLEQDEQERTIQGFNSLLALLCWAWLNRIVDQGTQVSIHCPMRLVKQIEARHVLEVLINRINPAEQINKPKEIFKKEAKPVSSLLFLSVLVDDEVRQRIESLADVGDPLNYIEDQSDLVAHCEQLIINSWGDIHVRHYHGNDGVLQCLCDWLNTVPVNVLENNEALTAYGYAAGISTFMAQRIIRIFTELREFTAIHKRMDCRFIVSLGQDYYCMESYDGMWRELHIGNTVTALYTFLEQANKQFKPLGMDRQVLATTPLREIASRNRVDVFQVFFQVTARQCDTWVLDDKGSIFYYRHAWFDRNSYVAHWLLLVRNIRNRLKKISYQYRELPTLEMQQIGFNRAGNYVFYPVGAESVKMERKFIDVQVSVVTEEEGDLLSLRCDGRNFSYEQFQQNVVNQCVEYIKQRIAEEDRLPIYVTDIQAPLRLFGVEQREDIQLVHFLKYKRNIENRLNQLVYG